MRLRSGGELAYRAGIGIAAAIPCAFLLLVFVYPACTLLIYGLGGERGFDTGDLAATVSAPRTWSIVATTLRLALAATAISAVIGWASAWFLYRLRFPGRRILRALVSVPFVLPTVSVSAGLRALFSDNGALGWLGVGPGEIAIVFAMVFFNVSLFARAIGSTWAHLNPQPEEAATLLGASRMAVFRDVTLPRLLPVAASVGTIVFLYCSSAYSIVLVLAAGRVSTLETEIYAETTQFFNLRAAAIYSLLQLILVVAVLVLARRLGRGRADRGSREANDRPLARRDLPAVGILTLLLATLICLPLADTLARSFTRDGQATWANYAALAQASATPALPVSVLACAKESVVTACQAATIAVIMAALTTIVVTRRPNSAFLTKVQGTFDAVIMLPLGVSAVTVGFGFLLTLTGPPLDLARTGWLVPLAQASVALPLAVRMMVPAMRALDPQMPEAASLLGASPARVLATIDLAFLARPAAIAWGYAFAISMGEFGATSFLVRPLTPTLPLAIYQLAARPGAIEQGMAAAASVLLGLLTAGVMMIVEASRDEKGTLL